MGEPVDLEAVVLGRGRHAERGAVVCAAELAAWLAGEPHSDRPACLTPVVTAFLRAWNDDLDDDDRQALKRSINPAILADRSGEADQRRTWTLVDWLARTHSARWLDAAGLVREAAVLHGLAPLHDPAAAAAAEQPLGAGLEAARRRWLGVVQPARSVEPTRSERRAHAHVAMRSAGARAALAAVEAGVRANVGAAVKEASRRAIRDAASRSRPSLREARRLARTVAHDVVRAHPLVAAGAVGDLAFRCGALAAWCGPGDGAAITTVAREARDDAWGLWQVLVNPPR